LRNAATSIPAIELSYGPGLLDSPGATSKVDASKGLCALSIENRCIENRGFGISESGSNVPRFGARFGEVFAR